MAAVAELVQDVSVTRFGAESLWAPYWRSLQRHRSLGATPRALDRADFDAVMADSRVVKLVLLDRPGTERPLGEPIGLATLTDHRDAVPTAAWSQLEARWPEHAADGRLWFVSFLVVAPEHEHSGAAVSLAGAIWTRAVAQGGVVAVDTALNDMSVRPASAMFHLARSASHRTTLQRVGEQGLWAYEFPEPVPA